MSRNRVLIALALVVALLLGGAVGFAVADDETEESAQRSSTSVDDPCIEAWGNQQLTADPRPTNAAARSLDAALSIRVGTLADGLCVDWAEAELPKGWHGSATLAATTTDPRYYPVTWSRESGIGIADLDRLLVVDPARCVRVRASVEATSDAEPGVTARWASTAYYGRKCDKYDPKQA